MVSDEVEGPNERFSKISGVLKLLGWRNGAEIEFCSVFKTTLCDQFCSLLPIGYKNKNGLPGWELDLKVWRARSGLYRRQILQGSIRWKALDEIYKIYIQVLLYRSDLKISAKIRPNFCRNENEICFFLRVSMQFAIFLRSLIFLMMKFCRNFTEM